MGLFPSSRAVRLHASYCLPLAAALSVPGLAFAAGSAPPAFQSVSLERSIGINGSIGAYDMFGGDSAIDSYQDEQARQNVASETLAVNMSFGLPYHDYYMATGDGRANVTSQLGAQGISFEALADVSMFGFGSFPYIVDGSGSAYVELTYTFDLGQSQAVWLGMNSEIAEFQDGDFVFSLMRLHPDGNIAVWEDTAIVNDQGEVQRNFSQQLALEAGQYVMTTRLNASSVAGDFGFSGRTWAQVSLKPHVTHMPEPSSWLLGTLGVGMVGWWARRNKATGHARG